jgi:hypothetical protein
MDFDFLKVGIKNFPSFIVYYIGVANERLHCMYSQLCGYFLDVPDDGRLIVGDLIMGELFFMNICDGP